MSSDIVLHSGGCHCGAIRWQVYAPTIIDAYDCKYVFDTYISFIFDQFCSCSICTKKQNRHFVVEKKCFQLLQVICIAYHCVRTLSRVRIIKQYIDATLALHNIHSARHAACKAIMYRDRTLTALVSYQYFISLSIIM